jgi:hypothetical protein
MRPLASERRQLDLSTNRVTRNILEKAFNRSLQAISRAIQHLELRTAFRKL